MSEGDSEFSEGTELPAVEVANQIIRESSQANRRIDQAFDTQAVIRQAEEILSETKRQESYLEGIGKVEIDKAIDSATGELIQRNFGQELIRLEVKAREIPADDIQYAQEGIADDLSKVAESKIKTKLKQIQEALSGVTDLGDKGKLVPLLSIDNEETNLPIEKAFKIRVAGQESIDDQNHTPLADLITRLSILKLLGVRVNATHTIDQEPSISKTQIIREEIIKTDLYQSPKDQDIFVKVIRGYDSQDLSLSSISEGILVKDHRRVEEELRLKE